MLNLFTSWYSSSRDIENELCLNNNILNPLINKIYLLSEDSKPFPKNEKVVGIRVDKKPTYNDFFKIINQLEPDISIISNSDIYFDETLNQVFNLKENEYALSRWDILEDNTIELFNRKDSQDSWIFKNKIKDINGDFSLGIWGCDNRIVYEIQKADYIISNPSLSIKSFHVHKRIKTDLIQKNIRIPNPYFYIKPSYLKGE